MAVLNRSLFKDIFCLSFLLSLTLHANVYAQDNENSNDLCYSQETSADSVSPCFEACQTSPCCTSPGGCGCGNIYLEHVEGDGIGYKQGYSTLGVFLSPGLINQTTSFFFDARAHVFNQGKFTGNIGGGVRFWNACIQRTFGLNAYYDCRNTCTTYHQVGLGLEMLGCDFDLRLNGYIPVGKRDRFSLEDESFYSRGRIARLFKRQYSLGGFDAEVETSLCRWFSNCCYDPYLAIGGYYFQGKHTHIREEGRFSYIEEASRKTHVRGGKVRLGISYRNFLSLEVRATCDNVYHTNVQGVIALNWPFGGSCYNTCNTCSSCCDYTCRPVIRDEIIVLNDESFWEVIDPCNPCLKESAGRNRREKCIPRQPTCDTCCEPRCEPECKPCCPPKCKPRCPIRELKCDKPCRPKPKPKHLSQCDLPQKSTCVKGKKPHCNKPKRLKCDKPQESICCNA